MQCDRRAGEMRGSAGERRLRSVSGGLATRPARPSPPPSSFVKVQRPPLPASTVFPEPLPPDRCNWCTNVRRDAGQCVTPDVASVTARWITGRRLPVQREHGRSEGETRRTAAPRRSPASFAPGSRAPTSFTLGRAGCGKPGRRGRRGLPTMASSSTTRTQARDREAPDGSQDARFFFFCFFLFFWRRDSRVQTTGTRLPVFVAGLQGCERRDRRARRHTRQPRCRARPSPAARGRRAKQRRRSWPGARRSDHDLERPAPEAQHRRTASRWVCADSDVSATLP